MRVFLPMLMLIFSTVAYAQGVRSFNLEEVNLRRAKGLYEEAAYGDAIPLLEQLVNNGSENQDVIYFLASSYAYTELYEKAAIQFEKLFSLNSNYSLIANYESGFVYSELNRFDEATRKYELFLTSTKEPREYEHHVHRAKYKLQYARQQKILQSMTDGLKAPVKLSNAVNTKYPEYLPMMDPTGKKLYFTSDRKGGISNELEDDADFDEDLFFIEKKEGLWNAPQLMPEPINTTSNDGAASFSADGQMMVYGACGREDGVGSCDLYISYLEGSQWSKPTNMGNVVNSEEWDAHSTISYDGNKIIFVSSRSGGYGNGDLYLTERNVFGDWGIPVNLGSTVNTPFDEASPFISQDGKTLYFSSVGHPGYGGFDTFKSVFENGKWSEPVNLGRPLNTAGSDKYFTIGGSGELGYFSSDREGNQLDLFEIAIPEDMRPQSTVVVTGIVTNTKTMSPLGAYIIVEDLNTGELIAANKSNSTTGNYLVVLPSGRNYSVSANKDGFFFYSQRFDVPLAAGFEEAKKDIGLKPIEKGAKVVLNNIFFESGKATLSPQSRLELQKAIDLMKQNPSMIIEVGGHTDNVGDDTTNMKLSHDRAKSVLNYLVEGGIATQRVQAKGYGESNPIAINESEDGRTANRRTEFIILEF
jgi:outer membrane protein OmpA-like peptidoglycan-associated protein/Tol biopolymer transport system component